jgi:hypothetical protein
MPIPSALSALPAEGRLAARLPHNRPHPGGRDPTSPRARHRAPPSGSGVPALLPTLEEPTPIATHARQGLPSPEPSPSPHGESLTTSVIKRTRLVNTCSGIHGLRPSLCRHGRKHGTAHRAARDKWGEGAVLLCSAWRSGCHVRVTGGWSRPVAGPPCHRPAPLTGRGRSAEEADPRSDTPPLTPEGARPAQTTSNARSW